MDATPLLSDDRWNTPQNENLSDFSITDYFKSLFNAEVGKYRIIVFLVTSLEFAQTEQRISLVEETESPQMLYVAVFHLQKELQMWI